MSTPTVPGPIDRVSFLDEQARHRREAEWLGRLVGVTIVLTGVPLSAVLTPIIAGFLILGLRLVGGVAPLPDAGWAVIRTLFNLLGRFAAQVERGPAPTPAFATGLGATIALTLPGVIALVALWLWVRGALLRERGGALGQHLGGRAPRTNDLEERQLENVIEEMAVAAGTSPPLTLLLDGPMLNAAALGASEERACVLVGRALLEQLDRDATQALVGHLVGSIANGDLRFTGRLVALFGTFGVLTTLLDAPFSPTARRRLGQLIGGGTTLRSEVIPGLLAESLSDTRTNEIQDDSTTAAGGVRGTSDRLVRVVLLPLMVTNMYVRMIVVLMGSFIIGPALAWSSRARRLLADATAVQLTRDPESLARALKELPASAATSSTRLDALFVAPLAGPGAGASAPSALTSGPLGDAGIVELRFHPPLEERLRRLAAQGAPVLAQTNPRPLPGVWNVLWRAFLAVLFIGPIGLVLGLSFLAFALEMALVGDVLVP